MTQKGSSERKTCERLCFLCSPQTSLRHLGLADVPEHTELSTDGQIRGQPGVTKGSNGNRVWRGFTWTLRLLDEAGAQSYKSQPSL